MTSNQIPSPPNFGETTTLRNDSKRSSRSLRTTRSGHHPGAMLALIVTGTMLLLGVASAQQETRIWYFGQNAGLDFNIPPATPTTPGEITTSAMSTTEGSAVIADRNSGQLLFYTNGIRVFDRNNTIMPGTAAGAGIGGGPSSVQPALAIGDLGNPNRYYIFTTAGDGTGDARFSIIDMTLRGGDGDIVPGQINLPLPTIGGTAPPPIVAEKLAATRDAAGTGFWVVIHEYRNDAVGSNAFYAYHLSAAGIDQVVVSNAGPTFPDAAGVERARGEMKFSPNGRLLATANEDEFIGLFRFNNTTGRVTFLADLGDGQAFGVSFSPNSQRLYVNNGWNQTPGRIFQYDVSSGTPAAIIASRVEIGTTPDGSLGGMQIAPDGRIYIAKNGRSTLAAINCPDQLGAAAGFVDAGFTFTGTRRSSWGLPNLILESVATPEYAGNDTAVCGPTRFRIGSTARPGYTYSWSPATGLDNPNIARPLLNATASGEYRVTVTNAFGCAVVDTVQVTVNPLPSVTVSPDTAICLGGEAHLDAFGPVGVSYTWSPATGLTNTNVESPVASPTVTTTYQVIIENANGCRDTASVTVTVNPLPSITTSGDAAICRGESVRLTANGGTGVTYRWEPATGLDDATIATPSASPLATTTYRVIVTNATSCRDTAEVTVTVNALPTAVVRADTAICAGASVQLQASGGTAVRWEPTTGLDDPNSPSPMATPLATTTYRAIVTNNNGCADTADVVVTVNPLPVAVAGTSADTICAGESASLLASGGVNYRWEPATGLSSTNTPTTVATPSVTTTYMAIVENENGCVDTARVTVTVLTPSLTLSIPDTVGDPHTRGFRIPVRIGSAVDLGRCTPEGVTISLLFNATLFNPTGVSRGTMTSQMAAGGMRRVTIVIDDAAALGEEGMLVELIGDVLLGNATTTLVTIDSVSWRGLDVTTTLDNGSLGILPYCLEGGPRLLNYPDGFGVKIVAPNPASDRVTVTVRSAEVGETRLEVYSMSGERVYGVIWDTGDQDPGATQEHEIILPRDIASGLYQVVLRSPSWIDAQTLIINK